MDKRLVLQLNANRRVSGVLRGFDPFMNVVLDEAVDEQTSTTVGLAMIRGNSILMVEAQERIQ